MSKIVLGFTQAMRQRFDFAFNILNFYHDWIVLEKKLAHVYFSGCFAPKEKGGHLPTLLF